MIDRRTDRQTNTYIQRIKSVTKKVATSAVNKTCELFINKKSQIIANRNYQNNQPSDAAGKTTSNTCGGVFLNDEKHTCGHSPSICRDLSTS